MKLPAKDSPATPSSNSVERMLAAYQITATVSQIEQVISYLQLLLAWNQKINLTAIRDPLEILDRHICESMYGAFAVPIEKGRLADVGSGGGFPGLPLKIIRPELELFLIESNVRKATFLAEVVRDLDLRDVKVLVSKYEDLHEEVTPLDFVCSRAVGEYGTLLGWAAAGAVAANRVVLWVGGRDLEEICTNDLWVWRDPIQIPRSLRRFLLVGDRKI